MKTLSLLLVTIVFLGLAKSISHAQNTQPLRVVGAGAGKSSANNIQRFSTFGQFSVGSSSNNEESLLRSVGFWSGIRPNQCGDGVIKILIEPGVIFAGSVSVQEGEMTTLRLKLSCQPSSTITLGASIVDAETGFNIVSGGEITFGDQSWDQFQELILVVNDDKNKVENESTDLIIQKTNGEEPLTAETIKLTKINNDILVFTRPQPEEAPVASEDSYRFTWDIAGDTERFQFRLYLFEDTELTFDQILNGDAFLLTSSLDSLIDAQGYTHMRMPVREGRSESTWFPHVLMDFTVISGPNSVTVQSGSDREAVDITFIEPKEEMEILYGQTLAVEAVIEGAEMTDIMGSNTVIVRFKKGVDEIPPGGIVESSDDGHVSLNNNFVPNSQGMWEVEIDWPGNAQFLPKKAARIFTVNKSKSTMDLAPLGATHVLGSELKVVGRLRIKTFNPGIVDLSGVDIEFSLTDPTGRSREIPSVQTTNNANNQGGDNGQFETVIPKETFDIEGNWQLGVATPGNENLMPPSNSGDFTLRVRQKRGYAILCQGSISASDGNRPEGVDDHRRTLDYVKAVLIANGQGLTDNVEDPNGPTDDIYEISYGDPKTELEKAITDWAPLKMVAAPAPLYIILINHGEIDRFHMHADLPEPMDNILNPGEISDWLSDLEEALKENSLAAEEKIIVILGMCFSGSFINELSNNSRIIVSASASNERSIRGPGDTNTRHGEYFVYLLFRELSNGSSLFDSFISSRDIIRQVSSRFGLATNDLPSEFSGQLGQHPLIDDNGDSKGSFILSGESDEGVIAKEIFLITPTNSVGTIEIARNNPSLFLAQEEPPQGRLWAEVDETPLSGTVDSIFMEVKKPGELDSDGGDENVSESMQAGLQLVKQLMNPNDGIIDRVRFEWPGFQPNLDVFNEPGVYQVFYYAKAKADSQPSEPGVSLVYRASGEFTPTSFDLISPENGAILDFNPEREDIENASGIFRWVESLSGADDIRYIYRLWRDENRRNLMFESNPRTSNFIAFTSTELPSGTFWWDVVAVDGQQNFTVSNQISKITIQLTNIEFPGIIFGTIQDETSQAVLADSLVEFTGDDGDVFVLKQAKGKYTAIVDNDANYVLTAKSEGFNDLEKRVMDVRSAAKIELDFLLSRKTNQHLVTISTRPAHISITHTLGAQDLFPIAVNSGTEVTLTAPRIASVENNGYVFIGWRRDDNSVISDETSLTFSVMSDISLKAEFELPGIQVYPGWNLISTPVILQDPFVETVFAKTNDNTFYHQGVLWTWEDRTFKTVSSLDVGRGYWVNSSDTALVMTKGSLTDPNENDIFCKKGWNLVGLKGLEPFSIPVDAGTIGIVWFWDGTSQQYRAINSEEIPDNQQGKFIPGQGYWVYVRSDKPISSGSP